MWEQVWSQTLVFHHNQERKHGFKKQTISWQRKCFFHSFGMDPQRVILESWLAGPWVSGEGPQGPGPLHLRALGSPGVLPWGPRTVFGWASADISELMVTPFQGT